MQLPGRWIRRLAWAAVGVLMLMAAAWWGVPALLVWQLPLRLGEALGRPVALQAAEFVPWRLDLTLHGLHIGAAATQPGAAGVATDLLQIDRLRADIGIASLRHRAPVIEALEIDGLRLNLARTAPGHYDIDDLIARFTAAPKAEPSGEPARFSLNNLALRDAQLRFDDRPVGVVHTVQALTLTLPFLSNLPDDVAIRTEPRLAFVVNGTKFDTGSQALPFAESRSGELSLAFADLDVAPALGYLPAGLPVKLQQAHVSSDLKLLFELPKGGTPSVVVKGRLALRDVALAEPGGAPLLRWQALALGLADVQPLRYQIGLDTLQLDGAELQLSRDARGRLNLQRLAAGAGPGQGATAAAPPAAASAPQAAAPAAPWTVTLASLKLADARVRWTDDQVQPPAALQLDGLALQVDGLRWPAPPPLPVAFSADLRSQRDGAPVAGHVALQGQANPQQAELSLQLDDLDLAALAPYLAQALQPRLSGRLSAKAQLAWAADPAALSIKEASASLQDLQLRDGAASSAPLLAALKQLQVDGVALDLPTRQLSIANLQLSRPTLAVARAADGRLNLQQWAAAAPGGSAPVEGTGAAAPAAPWRVALQDFSLADGQLQWRDEAATDGDTGEPVRADISGLKLRLRGLVWPAPSGKGAALPRLQLAAQIGRPAAAGGPRANGSVDWNGSVGLNPLQADGRLQVQRFPVHLFVPYAGAELPVSVLHADAGFQGRLRLRLGDAGWQVGSEGDVQINELQVNARPGAGARADSGEELLTWQSLALQGLSFAMAPPARPQLVVREVDLTEFYARLQITEAGRFNLQDVTAAPPAGATSAAAASAAAPASALPLPATAAGPPAAAASGAAEAPPAELALDLDIGGTQLRNGRVDFSDRFIRPNYSARLTELNGSIGRLRSGTREMATITLRGRAADTALLDISGQLNPTARPLALDIRARATDLELAPLSPYAAKYAGYGIERGKLSMDVSYKIDADGKLDAKNQIILNQLTFGDKVDSPSATKLPVLLAVALLTDRNGVIDINLPVGGSLNDPKFSVGGLIWQVIVNLLSKALTSPFALLSGGAANDLSLVEFRPGTAIITDTGRASLTKVASALTERPSLIMTVTGMADAVAEREAAQHAALEDKLQAEHRRERLRAAPAGAAAAAASAASAPGTEPPPGAEERARLLKRLYQQTALPDKPRNALGLLRDLPPAEMESRLRAAIVVNDDTLRELALQRGLAVRDALIATGLPSERLFLAAPKLRPAGEADAAWVPKVQLTLGSR